MNTPWKLESKFTAADPFALDEFVGCDDEEFFKVLSTTAASHRAMFARLAQGQIELDLGVAEALEDIANRYLELSENVRVLCKSKREVSYLNKLI